MEFEWDEDKRREIWEQRRLDILYAAGIFTNPVLTVRDQRHDYGETRYVSKGLVDGECFVVVHTIRDDRNRIITAWKGGKADYEQYQTCLARQH